MTGSYHMDGSFPYAVFAMKHRLYCCVTMVGQENTAKKRMEGGCPISGGFIYMGRIELGDSRELMKSVGDESIHLILSDIPYGIGLEDWDVLHDNKNKGFLGTSPAQKGNSLFKKRGKPLNGWSQADKNIPKEYYDWCMTWAGDWYRVLKPGASCFIFAGRRLSHRCVCAMEDSGFIFRDMLAWRKGKAAYRAQRLSSIFSRRGDTENSMLWEGWKVGNLKPLFEPILWFMKPYPQGSTLTDNVLKNQVGAFNEHALDGLEFGTGANIISVKSKKSDTGLHPAQKPVELMEVLISLTTIEGQSVLDPFCGCGTTLVAAKNLNRDFIGFELDGTHYNAAVNRIG